MDDLTNDNAGAKGAKGFNANPNAKASSKFKTPEVVQMVGIVTKIDASARTSSRSESKSEFRTLSLSTGESITVSEAIYQNNKPYMYIGASVVLEAEKRIEGVTGYVDSVGASVLHASTGYGFKSIGFQAEFAQANARTEAELAKSIQEARIKDESAANIVKLLGDMISNASDKDKDRFALAWQSLSIAR